MISPVLNEFDSNHFEINLPQSILLSDQSEVMTGKFCQAVEHQSE